MAGSYHNATANTTSPKKRHHRSRHNVTNATHPHPSPSSNSPSERRSRSLLTFLDHGKEEQPPSVVVVNSAPPPAQQPYFPQQLAAQYAPVPGQFGGAPVSSPAPVIAVRGLCLFCGDCSRLD